MNYNSQNQTTSVTPVGGSAVAMGYTNVGQTQRVTAGSTSFTNAMLLGVMSDVDSAGTTYYTRDNTGLLVAERQPSGTYYPLYDGLGSVVALTDASGNVVATYSYDPWGSVTGHTGTVNNPYQFGGSYGAYTDGTGLLKIGARYYDPALGRWTQPDSVAGALANPATLNHYQYVSCNPVNGIDSNGESTSGCVLAGVGLASAAVGVAVSGGLLDLGAALIGYGVSGAGILEECFPPSTTTTGGSGSIPSR